ncbi:hypothetical protein BDZ94DRAFT_1324562 [Collybia nuda]|uniref:Uncharacterized protein n=1 Tax=Collybia nuda TaxID=64659 RepID=A0A9P5Y1N1_9AGAR|nr:hypothetical protein BDZ94DRAFT_1324562 [Collybia nuda]
MMNTEEPSPPPYIPVLYDETHRGRWTMAPEIASMGHLANLTGYLEHHAPTTDGSFGICVAGGEGHFVSQTLYESIPEALRPALNTAEAGATVEFSLSGGKETAVGSVIMPIIFTNAITGSQFIVKLYALVLPNLLMGMFLSRNTLFNSFLKSEEWGGGKVTFICNFGNGPDVHIVHQLPALH